jgi:hypothetical protein
MTPFTSATAPLAVHHPLPSLVIVRLDSLELHVLVGRRDTSTAFLRVRGREPIARVVVGSA